MCLSLLSCRTGSKKLSSPWLGCFLFFGGERRCIVNNIPASATNVNVKSEKMDLLLVALMFTVAMNIYFGLVPALPFTLAELSSQILLQVKF